MREDRYLLRPGDIGVGLLCALACLTPVEREAWVNYHVLGESRGPRVWGTYLTSANRKLREHFGAAEALRVAA